MMSLAKSFFPLTAYMKKDPEFGEFFKQIIYDEF
jgi:phosphoenolpyruvate carboxylase